MIPLQPHDTDCYDLSGAADLHHYTSSWPERQREQRFASLMRSDSDLAHGKPNNHALVLNETVDQGR
jgi:hypothetical protein